MKTYEVLEKALALIEDEANWSPSGFGAKGTHCAVGACIEVAGSAQRRAAVEALREVLRKRGESPLPMCFNDSHSHTEVVALFQEAIRNEKAKAGVPVDLPAPVAQMAEPAICNREGAGSIPAGGLLLGGGERG